MIILHTYHDINPTAWQELVDTSPYATWFQTPEAYEFYAANPEEMIPFTFGVECEGELRAVIVGYITKEKSALKQFFTRRAIIIGGPLLADDATAEEISALLNVVKNLPCEYIGLSPIYIEIRNFHDYSRWKDVFQKSNFAYQPHYDIHVHCTATHIMSEQRIRQMKKAIKNGGEIALATSEQEIRNWYQILSKLYCTKVRAPLFSEGFFLQFYRANKGIFLLVKYRGKVIGGMMCPILNGKVLYEWYVCGLDEEYHDLYPSVMATYAAIEYAKNNSLPLFDFMGAGKPNIPYGVRDFKMEFGGQLVEYGRFLCVRKPILCKIGELGMRLIKKKKY